MSSIRRKLLLTLIGALLAMGFVAAVATFFSAQLEFNKFLDTHLKETAEALSESVMHNFPGSRPRTSRSSGTRQLPDRHPGLRLGDKQPLAA